MKYVKETKNLKKDDEREEDGNGEGHFFPGVRGEVEDHHAEAGDEDAGQDQVDRVVEGLATEPERILH